MILRLVIDDNKSNTLEVSEVNNDNQLLITLEGNSGQSFILLDKHYTKELAKFLNKQLKNFPNE